MKNAIKAITEGVSYVGYYKTSLLKALLVPLALLALIKILGFLPNIDSNTATAIKFLKCIPLTLIAITTHKIILDGPNSVPSWGINRFGTREFKFIGNQFLVFIVALPTLVLAYIPHLGIFIMITAIAYIVGRLSLVFPSIAIGEDIGLKDSWEATKNYKLMMVVVVVLFPLILRLLEETLKLLPGMFWIGFLTSPLTIIFVVSSLSSAYKIVMES
ncbi:MAG: hypothetical protein P8104_01560 [Gammaproteobacteria bacterium]